MTLQDLKDNRNRIIKRIVTHKADVKKTMEIMAIWMKHAKKFISMDPTLSNIAKITKKAIKDYFKYHYNQTKEECEAAWEASRKEQMANLY